MPASSARAERERPGVTGAPRAHGRPMTTTRRSTRPATSAASRHWLRPGTGGRGAVAPSARRRHGEDDGECGCARRHHPNGDRSRTQRAAVRAGTRDNRSARGGLAGNGEQLRKHERRVDHGLSRSGGEPGAALRSPVLQQRPARAGAHAVTEPVLLVAASVVGLERALHAWPPRARLGAQIAAPGARARLRRPRSLRLSSSRRQSYETARTRSCHRRTRLLVAVGGR
jgi:hypothetical protein